MAMAADINVESLRVNGNDHAHFLRCIGAEFGMAERARNRAATLTLSPRFV